MTTALAVLAFVLSAPGGYLAAVGAMYAADWVFAATRDDDDDDDDEGTGAPAPA